MAEDLHHLHSTATGDQLMVTLTTGQFRQLVSEAVENVVGAVQDDFLTAQELADRLKVPVSWVYEQSRQGKIPTHRIGRYLRFSVREVLESQKDQN